VFKFLNGFLAVSRKNSHFLPYLAGEGIFVYRFFLAISSELVPLIFGC